MRRASLHLSTCLLTMLVAAGLLWINFANEKFFDPRNPGQGFPIYRYVGWPCPALAIPPPNHPDFETVLGIPLIINVCVAFAILSFASILFEWVARSLKNNDLS